MNFKGSLKILEMSRFARAAPIGRDLARGREANGGPSNPFVRIRCNLTQALTREILRANLKFLKSRDLPYPKQ